MIHSVALTLFLGLLWIVLPAAAAPRLVRVPDGGIQPHAAYDGDTIHLIYFKGDPLRGNVLYVRSTDGGKTFSGPLPVNSQPDSAIAIGTVRGAHLALGRDGRVHVAWMGSDKAEPKVGGKSPMLYARLNDAGTAFEPQRNVIAKQAGLDGGGSVAADAAGNVYVAWHAPETENTEADRHVWIARAGDDGQTFEPESPINPDPIGTCSCCGLRTFATAGGRVLTLYRSARENVNRDMILLTSDKDGSRFRSTKLSAWKTGQCPMSTSAIAEHNGRVVAAWETEGQIEVALIDPDDGSVLRSFAVPGPGENRKHPSIAISANGQFLVAWTEGTGWNKGGAIAWQQFDAEGNPLPKSSGRAEGLPAWSLPAAVAASDGRFIIIY